MSSISFDKDEYNRGETATITYVDAPADGYIQIVAPDRTYPYTASKSGSGTVTWLIPANAPLGQYTVELWSRSFRFPLRDTMNVVSGVPPPPVEGETRELDVGDYEVTWTLSGNDILKAEIRVTDTGVTCLSVTGGACNSITAPGVLVIAFTVTGYLKSAVAPPTEGYLRVTTSPTGALVMVNGTSCGATPVTKCTLSTGTKTVTFTKSGYETVTRTVTIRAGEITDIGTITLTPMGVPPVGEMTRSEFLTELQNRGEIEVSKLSTTSGPDKWYLYRNVARYSGGGYGIEIHALDYKNPPPDVSFIKFLGARGYVNTIPQEWGLARINELPFVGVAPPTKGYLTVNTSPAGASVTVDIVFPCGTTPVTKCELDTGTKTVKITKAGYNTETRSVTITAGATTNLGTITLTPTGVPPVEIGSWIDESGVTNLTKDHAVYVFFVSAGAVSAADGKYAKLSPKPSRMDPSLASKDNAIGIFFYSQGAMAAGNGKTGCNY